MKKIKIGLLPLYAELYDDLDPDAKYTYTSFIDNIEEQFASYKLDVQRAEVCVREKDIISAVNAFEEQGACSIIILFLAYHPSLVSASALSQTKLPLIILDTTECYEFGPSTDPAMVMRCHGIHGVQDLCCVLTRKHKDYMIETGHLEHSDIIARTVKDVQACFMADRFKKSRVGIIGKPFENMGDFVVPFDELEHLTGIKTTPFQSECMKTILDDAKKSNIGEDLQFFEFSDDLDENLKEASSLTTRVISTWVDQEQLTAFTFNFLDFDDSLGFPTIPFGAASYLMSRGIGYAGEGDVITAALVAAVMNIYPESTFTEMFCPDWKNGTVFMSHMGEANRAILEKCRLFRNDVPYVRKINDGIVAGVSGRFKGGAAVLINLAPSTDGGFRLILSTCEIVSPEGEDRFENSIRGWMRPSTAIEEFLKKYSMLGGTHHSCLSYGADLELLKTFGKVMGWEVYVC